MQMLYNTDVHYSVHDTLMFIPHLLLDYINECSSEGSYFLLYDGTHALHIDYNNLTVF